MLPLNTCTLRHESGLWVVGIGWNDLLPPPRSSHGAWHGAWTHGVRTKSRKILGDGFPPKHITGTHAR